jgi:hypothetical protein
MLDYIPIFWFRFELREEVGVFLGDACCMKLDHLSGVGLRL